MALNFLYTKLRKNFGRQTLFSDKGPELCDSISPDIMIQKIFILRNPVNQNTQHGPVFSHREVNTIRAVYSKCGVNHGEGGWPKDINVNDPESTQRYRRKVEKDEDYIHCIMTITPGMEHYIRQNNAIDLYNSYYSGMDKMKPIEQPGCRTVNVFEKSNDTRAVSSICWRPNGGFNFATCYVNMNSYHKPIGPVSAYIWNTDNPSVPITTFEPPDTLLDLQYNPRDDNILVGGLANGQVVCFDQRVMIKPTVISNTNSMHQKKFISPEFTSHREMVRKINFLSSKSGAEFFSGSSDGTLKWWDIRNMEEPTDEQIMHYIETVGEEQSLAKASGVSTMQYETTLPTRFMVGSEDGFVISGNRKGKTAIDKLPAKYTAHNGIIRSLERNPQFLKNFLTVGDWTMKIWSEDCRESCIMCTPQQRIRLTSATWSPTRPSLISTTVYNGQYAAWDMLRKQHEPIFTQQICQEPLLKISAHEAGQLVACGSKLGKVYLIELTPALAYSDKNDKNLMAAVFERESKRERILESRLREIRLKQRQAEEGVLGSPKASIIDMSIDDKDLIETTNDYAMQVKKEQAMVY